MRLQKVISNLTPELLRVGEYQLAKVTHVRAIADLYGKQLDGILVASESVLKEVLLDDRLFLTPLFFIGDTHRQCDGSVADESDPAIKRKLEVLLPAIEAYTDIPLPADGDRRLLTKLLRYLLTRRTSLHAVNSRQSTIGYCFPLIEDMSIEADPLHIIKHMQEYAAQDYFSTQPVDKINICYDCHGSYLNFSECCTKCNSLDLKSEQLVHHFRCAYVGPQSDFVKDEKLICPKCDHQLKHIGIDYDKPSEIHTCRSCNHSSQETKMKAKCVDCSKENELDQLVTYEINNYKPTEKAKAYAGQRTEQASFGAVPVAAETALLSMGAYTLIRSHEGRKAHQGSTDTYDMVITVDDALLAQLNSGMQRSLLEELATIVRPYLEANDLLAIDEHKHIHALLIDYEHTAARQMVDVLHYNLNKMLRDNGWGQTDVVTITVNTVRS